MRAIRSRARRDATARSWSSSRCRSSSCSGSPASPSTAARPSRSAATSRRPPTWPRSQAPTTTSSTATTTRPSPGRAPSRPATGTPTEAAARPSTSTIDTIERDRGDGRHRGAPPQHDRRAPRDADLDGVHARPPRWPASPTRPTAPRRSSSRHRRVQRRRDAAVPDADRLRRGQRRRADQPARLRLDELRDRQRQHERGQRRSSTAAWSSTRRSTFGEYIGQHNNGNHTALYGDVDTHLSGHGRPGRHRRRQRQLRGLVDVPRHQRRRRLGQARPRLLRELVRERPAVGHGLRRQRLPALPRVLRPEALGLNGPARPALGRRAPPPRPRRPTPRRRAGARRTRRRRTTPGSARHAPARPACAAIRRSASARRHPPAQQARPLDRAARRSTSQTSSHSAARPPSTSLIASITTAGAPAASAASIAARIRGRTAGWTIASRSRERRRVGEDEPRQGRPVERPVRRADRIAERARGRRRGPARRAPSRPGRRRRRRRRRRRAPPASRRPSTCRSRCGPVSADPQGPRRGVTGHAPRGGARPPRPPRAPARRRPARS